MDDKERCMNRMLYLPYRFLQGKGGAANGSSTSTSLEGNERVRNPLTPILSCSWGRQRKVHSRCL
jgi:hypothetical protein